MIAIYMIILVCIGIFTCLVWVVATQEDSEEEAKRKGLWVPWTGLMLVCIGFVVIFIEYGALPALTSLISLF